MELQEKKYSLKDLVENYAEIEKSFSDSEFGVPEELSELRDIATSLMAGKVDKIATLLAAIDSEIVACEKQVDYLTKMKESVLYLTKEALDLHPDKRIDGLSYVAKLNKKGRKSVEILNEALIPEKYYRYNVTIKDKFPAGDKEKYAFYATLLLGREYSESEPMTAEEVDMINKSIQKELSKTIIEEDLKKDPASVPGAKFSDDIYYLKIEAGKSKAVTKVKENAAQ
jgi:hypothetical protein